MIHSLYKLTENKATWLKSLNEVNAHSSTLAQGGVGEEAVASWSKCNFPLMQFLINFWQQLMIIWQC